MHRALGLFLSFLLILLSCRNESTDRPRAYIEGKIISQNIDLKKFKLKIVSNEIVTGETLLKSDKSFILSGPVAEEGFRLQSSEKISSFSSENRQLTLSEDSLNIIVPSKITYLKFNHMTLTK